jgi:hypothetical protein
MSSMVPENYPFAMSDEALQAAVGEMLETTRSVYSGVSFAKALPELKLAIVMAGLQELSRRETAELRVLTAKAAKAADRASKYALMVAALALLVAVASLVVAVISLSVD